MQLGIGSYTYGWAVGTEGERPPGALSALDLIDRAEALGVGLVQLCDNLPAETFEHESVEAIAARAARSKIRVQVGTRGSAPGHLRRFAWIAHRLGSDVLRVVIDEPGDEPEPGEVIRRLRAVTAEFKEAGVTLAVENHDRFPSATLRDIVRAVESPRLGICLDTVNSFGALEGPRVVVETLGPLVANLHLKDFAVGRVPCLQGFVIEGRPLGCGMLDVPWLLDRLREFGRDPDAIVEHWVPPEAEIEQTLKKEFAWAELSVKAARAWIQN
jgi:sugar phosphate isomerase/epimerase